MSAADLLGILLAFVAATATVGGAGWKLGRDGKGGAALTTYRELATAQGMQIDDLKAENRGIKAQNADQQHQIELLRAEVERLKAENLQRAKVDELRAEVHAGFAGLGERVDTASSQILGRINEMRAPA